MNTTSLSLSALIALAGFALPAHAKPAVSLPNCAASTTVNSAGYVSCLGSFSGNMDNQLDGAGGIFAAIEGNFGLDTSSYFSSESFSAAGNPFAQNEGSLDDGVINFDQALTGSFVLGLKQGNAYSLYMFDGAKVAGGISSIAFDTNGVWKNSGNDLSHAGFFGTVTAVPEPTTYAMLLAGLAAVGFVARRRTPV